MSKIKIFIKKAQESFKENRFKSFEPIYNNFLKTLKIIFYIFICIVVSLCIISLIILTFIYSHEFLAYLFNTSVSNKILFPFSIIITLSLVGCIIGFIIGFVEYYEDIMK